MTACSPWPHTDVAGGVLGCALYDLITGPVLRFYRYEAAMQAFIERRLMLVITVSALAIVLGVVLLNVI